MVSIMFPKYINHPIIGLSLVVIACNITFTQVASNQEHTKESAEFQAINSYMTQIVPLEIESNEVNIHLEEAKKMIDAVGFDVFSKLNPKRDEIGLKFEPLLDNDPKILLNIISNLITASESCDQEHINFLMLIINEQSFNGQFLNKYAQSLLHKCLKTIANLFSKRVEKTLGKLDNELFELVEEVAISMNGLGKSKPQRMRGAISIVDADLTRSQTKVLESLKQVNFDTPRTASFALSLKRKLLTMLNDDEFSEQKLPESEQLNNLYRERLVKPCKYLIERIYEAFSSFTEDHEKPSELIAKERILNPQLDYFLEMFRICELVISNKSQLRMSTGFKE